MGPGGRRREPQDERPLLRERGEAHGSLPPRGRAWDEDTPSANVARSRRLYIGRGDIESSASGNPFNDRDLVIGRIDLLKQDDNLERLKSAEWDLVVVDESHKMSAHYYGNEVKRTGRYRLGEELGTKTLHLLMLTATPHNGKDEDFQLWVVGFGQPLQ